MSKQLVSLLVVIAVAMISLATLAIIITLEKAEVEVERDYAQQQFVALCTTIHELGKKMDVEFWDGNTNYRIRLIEERDELVIWWQISSEKGDTGRKFHLLENGDAQVYYYDIPGGSLPSGYGVYSPRLEYARFAKIPAWRAR
jgi:hypothetical protein